jgi:hypothetical protein
LSRVLSGPERDECRDSGNMACGTTPYVCVYAALLLCIIITIHGDHGLCTHFEEIDDHVPLPTVADKIATEEIDEAIIEGKVCVLKRELKVIIGFVELVVEEQVGLYDL